MLAGLLPLMACGGAPKADPALVAKGQAVFRSCASCHSIGADHRVGPGLKGVVGRKAGSAAGFSYSQALTEAGWTWDEARLVAFLSTENYLPGSNMVVTPLSEEDARAVAAFLGTL
jgi:cytochrome c